MTCGDLLYTAYRIAGILGEAGRGMSAGEVTDGIQAYAGLVDSLKSQRMAVYAVGREEHPLTPGKPWYSVGPTGDIKCDRPIRIERAGLQYSSPESEIPIEVLRSEQEWQGIRAKTFPGPVPRYLYYEAAVPNGNIYLNPVPTQANSLILYPWRTLNTIRETTDAIEFPTGYREMVEYNLARKLAAMFPLRQRITPEAMRQAEITLMNVKAMNAVSFLTRTELSAGEYQRRGQWNIFTNTYNI